MKHPHIPITRRVEVRMKVPGRISLRRPTISMSGKARMHDTNMTTDRARVTVKKSLMPRREMKYVKKPVSSF